MRRMGLAFPVAIALLLLCGLCQTAIAQFSGNVSGVITDPSGAVVPGAAVTLRNVNTGEMRSAVSSTSGLYQFVSLAPGRYELTTTMSGFSTSRVTVTLETSQNLNTPIRACSHYGYFVLTSADGVDRSAI